MRLPLRVLILEDSPDDADLIAHELRARGYAPLVRRVETAEEMREALEKEDWDVVLSDYNMPRFSAPAGLGLLKETGRDIPFIIISGSIGDEEAVKVMRAGAHDYLRKGSLTRLGAVVERELREAELRRQKRLAERGARFSSEASQILAQSLDYEETVRKLAGLVVPAIADGAAIFMSEEGEEPKLVALAHCDPAREELLRRLDERFGCTQELLHAPGAVLVPRTAGPLDPEQERILRELGWTTEAAVPLRARGRTLGVLSLVTVVASRRRLGENDLPFLEELGDRAAVAIDNARLYRDAQRAIRARDEFLSIAAHELNTPLAALQLRLDSLQRHLGLGKQVGAPDLEKLDGAVRYTARLAGLVTELLDVTRITAGRMVLEREEVDVAEVVRDVAAELADAAASAGSKVDVDVPASLVGRWDRLRLEQVVRNLLSNAIKFGEGRPIDVRVEKRPASAHFAVTDRGIGISAELQGRLFGRFERGVPVRHFGGLGLGLFVSQQIIAAHGGTIEAQSAPGAGSTFTVTLPLAPPPDGE